MSGRKLAITASEIRNRLLNVTTIELTDSEAEDASRKEAADAWGDLVLSFNGTTESKLSDAQCGMLKVAKLDYAVLRVISRINREGGAAGPFKTSGLKASDMADNIKLIKSMITDTLELLGFALPNNVQYISGAGSSDYMPDGVDSINIDFADQSGDAISVFN